MFASSLLRDGKQQLDILPRPTDLERQKDVQQGLGKTVAIQEPVLVEEFIIPVSSPIALQSEDLGEDSSTLRGEKKLPKIETPCRISVKT